MSKYLLLVLVFVSSVASATVTTTHPTSVSIKKGTASGSPSAVAAVAATDSSYSMLGLDANKDHVTWWNVTMPAVPSGDVLTQVDVYVPASGNPASSGQIWKLQIQNVNTAAWDDIGSNSGSSGTSYTIHGVTTSPQNYGLTSNGTANIRVISTGSKTYASAMQIDEVKVDVTITTPSSSWTPPTRGQQWEIRYAGAVPADNSGFDILNVDLEDTTQAKIAAWKSNGTYVICYFSAGSYENWRSDATQFDTATKGNNMDGWAGEKWVDVRALTDLMPIMEARMDVAVTKGCDAVDPDNMDGYDGNSTGFPLVKADNVAYLSAMADAAHSRGLAIGQKNAMGMIADLDDKIDFYVNEQCYEYSECSTYSDVLNNTSKVVFNIEYTGSTGTFCPVQNAAGFDTLKKTLDLNATITSCR